MSLQGSLLSAFAMFLHAYFILGQSCCGDDDITTQHCMASAAVGGNLFVGCNNTLQQQPVRLALLNNKCPVTYSTRMVFDKLTMLWKENKG